MFKNGVTLSKNSWHVKFLSKMYGIDAREFKNFCPYFWAFIGTIAFLPIILFMKGVVSFISWCMDIPEEKDLTNTFNDKMLKLVIHSGRFIVNSFKFIMTLLFTFVITIGMTMALHVAINSFYDDGFMTVIAYIVSGVIAFAIICLFGYFSAAYAEYLDDKKHEYELDNNKFELAIFKVIDSILYVIVLLFNIFIRAPFRLIKYIFKTIFNFIFRIIKKIYNNNCPLINWK